MKTWQLLLLGTAALIFVFLLPHYERMIASAGAILTVAAVLAGFLMHPRREIYLVRTKTWVATPDDVSRERDCIAVRLEVARLWVLFLPTFLAVAFLVVTATQGTLGNFSLAEHLNYFIGARGSLFILAARVIVVITWAIISTWVNERWVFHYADSACSANSASIHDGRVSYSFKDRRGEYFGGEGIVFGLMDERELATLVFYSQEKPERNKIAINCLLHRFVIIGRGITDLDEDTVAAHLPALAES